MLDGFRNKNCCPNDNIVLTDKDLFPDLYTLREIKEITKPCPNAANGCIELLRPIDIDAHLVQCMYRREPITSTQDRIQCPFTKQGCSFETSDTSQLDAHCKMDMHKHLNVG